MFGDLLIRSRSGDVDALGELSIAIDNNTAMGDWLFVPFYKTIQVSELFRHNRIEQAPSEAHITEGFIEQTGEEWVLPELLRLKGEAKRSLQDDDSAQSYFMRAAKLAAEQSAKSWELRATTSLASLLAQRGQAKKARKALQPVHDWFTEGHNTKDLKNAKALLDALS